MQEVETELYKVGVPVKTRHNEVAPSQYELAPIFENANVATDHQMMTMEMMRRMAPKYGAGVPPAREAVRRRQRQRQARQLEHDRRLGQQPVQPGRHAARQHPVPGVLRGDAARGEQVAGPAAHVDRERRQRPSARRERSAAGDHLGVPRRSAHGHLRADRKGRREADEERRHPRHGRVSVLPKLPRDAGDRNRTSPFAFTGNKFEFRAVSANQSIAFPNIALNVAMTESLDYVATKLEEAVKAKKSIEAAVQGSAAEADQGEQADHLQRQRLLGRVARRKPPSAAC